jgi:hypothetical protein
MASRAGAVTLNQPRDTSVGSPSSDVDLARPGVKGRRMPGPAPRPGSGDGGLEKQPPV